ncbi:MAG: hypothetical protein EOP86_13200 [Verrucomicrobiaceae bacterium]|nr:MAG: hypothetical protein EOP86_13200 [Verrucomicrobiaceae bacterium]
MKKQILSVFSGLALFSGSLMAAPLQRSHVSADAKWIVHLDMEGLRQSQFGSAILKFALTEFGDELKDRVKLDVPAIVNQTSSITAYGDDFKPGPEGRGVLIWQGSKEIEQVVTAILLQQSEASKAGEGSIKAMGGGLNPVYEISPNLYTAVRPGQGILVSPKIDQIHDACRIIEGKASSLKDEPTFSEYTAQSGGFFLVALAEGFVRDAGLPPQAQVLKLAEGGRIALGEAAGKLQLSVNLKANTTENAVQIQQVIQGLVALAGLADVDEPELAQVKDWVRSAQVTSKEKIVSLDLAVPVDAALNQLSSATGHQLGSAGEKTVPAPEEKPAPSPQASSESTPAPAVDPAR